MNSIVKLALAFVGGAAVGSGATYLVTKKLNQKKNDGVLDDISDKIEAAYEAKLEEAYDEIGKLHETIIKYEKEEYERLTNPNRYHLGEAIAHKYEDGIPDIPPAEKEHEDETIYAITVNDFMEDVLFDKGYLTYYREDGVLSTESDEMVEDPAYTLGEFGKHMDIYVGNTAYIRNSRVGCDYQIVFIDGSYSEEVLGNED